MIIATLILGTYALTLALTESAGPWGLLERLRNIKAVQSFGLLECGLCCSAWVSLALCIALARLDLWLLTFGASVVLDKLITAYTIK